MKFASAERQNGVFKVPSEVGWWKVRIWEVTTVEVRVFILSSCTVTVVQNVTYWTRIPVVWSQVQLFRYFNNRRGCIWNNWVICKITELKGLEDDLRSDFFFFTYWWRSTQIVMKVPPWGWFKVMESFHYLPSPNLQQLSVLTFMKVQQL